MHWKPYIAHFFFILYFIIGISIVNDYGCSWDEDRQMIHGRVSAKELCKKLNWDCPELMESAHIPALQEYEQKYYGTFFQLTAIAVDYIFDRKSFPSRINTRHFLGFILFFFGSICFYLLLRSRFDKLLSLIGVIVYISTPRIFAHTFFNPKDTIFLSFFVICLYTLSRFLKKRGAWNLFLFSLTTALMLNARILGLSLFCIALITILFYKQNVKQNAKWVLLYILKSLGFLFLIWPLLWEDSFSNLRDAFSLFSQYPWSGELLYWGNYISSFELPWHYIPSWILITTPPVFLLFITLGLLFMSFDILKQYRLWFKNYNLSLDSVIMAVTLGPLLAIIVFNSVVYGGWRHMYFMHAGLCFALVYALDRIIKFAPKYKKHLFIIISLGIAVNVFKLVKLHPLQHVYFNSIVGNSLENFEQDYWGVSMKVGMEKLTEFLPADELSRVFAYDYPAWCNYRILNKDTVQLEFTWEVDKADFFIDNFRRKEHIESYLIAEGLYAEPIHITYRQGNPIVGIFKLTR